MWGGLRQTLAHAAAKGAENIQNTGGLIAKIGQVVAPQGGPEEIDEMYDDDAYEEEEEELEEISGKDDDEEEEVDYDQGEGYPVEHLQESSKSKTFGTFVGGVMHTAKALQSTASRLTTSLEHSIIDNDNTVSKKMELEETMNSIQSSPIVLSDSEPSPIPITQPTFQSDEQLHCNESDHVDPNATTYPELSHPSIYDLQSDGRISLISQQAKLEQENGLILEDVSLPETSEKTVDHAATTFMEENFLEDHSEENDVNATSFLQCTEISTLQRDHNKILNEKPTCQTDNDNMTDESTDFVVTDRIESHKDEKMLDHSIKQQEQYELMAQLLDAHERIQQLQLEQVSQSDTSLSLYNTLKQEKDTLIVQLEEANYSIQQLRREISQNSLSLQNSFKQDKEMLLIKLNEANQLIQQMQLDASQKTQDTQLKLKQLTQTHEQEVHRILEESTLQYTRLEAESKNTVVKLTASMGDMEKKHAQALERLEKKLSRAIRDREDKEEEIMQLKNVIADMRTTLKENVEGAAAAEEEADELELENEELHKTIESLQTELQQVQLERKRLDESQQDLLGVRMELELVKEERDRQREKLDASHQTHIINYEKVVAERDAAKAQAMDLEQQLVAVTADLKISQADLARLIAMNTNLQRALEAFQIERESELALLEEHKKSSEQVLIEAHKTELKAVKDSSDQMVREMQLATEKAVTNLMQELSASEKKVEEYRKECITTRRSLDEAIHQLQRNQEDVIDRSVIKNILLDWHMKSGKSKKDVMLILSSLLHLSEDEKEKCGLGINAGSLAEKLVVAVAPPLTPARVRPIDEIEGDTVRDKFVNFILAELGDDHPKSVQN